MPQCCTDCSLKLKSCYNSCRYCCKTKDQIRAGWFLPAQVLLSKIIVLILKFQRLAVEIENELKEKEEREVNQIEEEEKDKVNQVVSMALQQVQNLIPKVKDVKDITKNPAYTIDQIKAQFDELNMFVQEKDDALEKLRESDD